MDTERSQLDVEWWCGRSFSIRIQLSDTVDNPLVRRVLAAIFPLSVVI